MYEEFINPDNGFYYVFVEGPSVLLGAPIPEGANNSTKITIIDGEPVESQKTIMEYLTIPPYVSKDGSKAIILLNEMLEPRYNGVTEDNIDYWNQFLEPLGLGYSSGNWMGIDQSACSNKVSDKLMSDDYRTDDII